MKNFCFLLLLATSTACLGFSGCGGSLAQVHLPVGETKQPIVFSHGYETGREIARQERKPMLTFFFVPENVGAQRMMETTFCDDEIKRLAEKLVYISVDGSQESSLCEELKISSFPTIILSNASGMEVRRLVGRQTPDQLAVQLHILLQATALRPQGIGR